MAKIAIGITGINIQETMKNIDISSHILSRYDAGIRGIDYSQWAFKNRTFEVYETGKHVEFIVAWMFGNFAAKVKDKFRVEMSDYLDHVKKADFLLIRNGKKCFVQIKFNNDKFFVVPHDVKLIKLGPPSTFEGGKFLESDTGSSAFVKMLSETGIYEEEELYDFFDECPSLDKSFNNLWRTLKY